MTHAHTRFNQYELDTMIVAFTYTYTGPTLDLIHPPPPTNLAYPPPHHVIGRHGGRDKEKRDPKFYLDNILTSPRERQTAQYGARSRNLAVPTSSAIHSHATSVKGITAT